ncbi:energy transducer TonB [Qipengyuania sp. MTN3-11]|uniref:energy transducer TonB n=1 Tax=Qipengyuania sp. MTN3-11 TaxID=3056557 RepID=UPI0036F2C7CA
MTGLALAVLIWGIGIALPLRPEAPALASFALEEPLPLPTPTPTERPAQRDERRAAPKDEAGERNLRNRATPVVAPPVEPLIVLPPIIAAPEPDAGAAAQTGASERPGPGRGAGNRGDGLGGGGTGGEGDGTGRGEAVIGPRRISGTLSYRDLPEGVLTDYGTMEVEVVYTVTPGGRATGCRAERSSGSALLDRTACRLIEQRFRFRPARDARGRAVEAMIAETHGWFARPQ